MAKNYSYDSYLAGASSAAFKFDRKPPPEANKYEWLRGYDEYPDRLKRAKEEQFKRTVERMNEK